MGSCIGKKDPNFRPVKPRGCTDIFCLIIFFLFWALFIFLAAFALVVGSPMRLIHGYDSFGNICGKNNQPMGNLSFAGLDMTDKPYVFYLNMADVSRSLKICVKACPSVDIRSKEELANFHSRTGSLLCRYDVENVRDGSRLYPKPANASISRFFASSDEKMGYGPCPRLPIYASKAVLNRCVPESLYGATKDVVYSIYGYLNSIDVVQQVVSDLYASWIELLIMIIAAVLFSVLTVLLIYFLASFVSWIIMGFVALSSIAVTGILWWTYSDIKWGLDSTPFERLLEESAKNERAFLVYAIISTIITIILLLIIFALRKQVDLMIALFKEAGKCIRKMPCLLVQPIWTFFFLALFFAFWLAVLLSLATADYPVKRQDILPLVPIEGSDSVTVTPGPHSAEAREFTKVAYDLSAWVRHMWWFHLIALIWGSEFILACQQMVIAGSVASWYFTRDRSTLTCPIFKSTFKLIVYHIGSVALGSFLITIFKLPRLILLYVQKKAKQYEGNVIGSCCLKCCNCFFWCLEKFIRYLNHNAYTVIAIESIGFCGAARIAFGTLVTNAARVATINSVGDFILFLGKCSATAITAVIGLLLLKTNRELHFYAIPVFIGCVFAFFIAHCIISIYEMVIDTLFLCFCEDCNKNDGTPGREYYAPVSLMKFLSGESRNGENQPLRDIKATGSKDVNEGAQGTQSEDEKL